MPKPIIRSFAFLANWIAWVIRQPAMLLTMILGPFIILALFAFSNATQAPIPNVIVVEPPGQQSLVPIQTLNTYFHVVGTTSDTAYARQQLANRNVDAVVVMPDNPQAQLSQGQQATITVETNEIDPITVAFLKADLNGQMAELNKAVQKQSVDNAKTNAAQVDQQLGTSLTQMDKVDADANNPDQVRSDVNTLDGELGPSLDQVPTIAGTARAASVMLPQDQATPVAQQADQAQQNAVAARGTLALLKAEADSPSPNPDRIHQLNGQLRSQVTTLKGQVDSVQQVPTTAIVQPFQGQVQQIARYQPTLIGFYAPAALALLLQHFAVTLAALSMVRARMLGMVEFWRIAPIRASEIIAGNYLSYGILSVVAWAALTAAVVYLLGVPVLGSITYLVGAAILLILAALGIGFVISIVASNEQQAAQLAMLVLLASVFLSGFVRPLNSVDFPVRYVSYLLPATFGIQLFQDIMLRGIPGDWWFLPALGGLALVGLWITLSLFRRELKPA